MRQADWSRRSLLHALAGVGAGVALRPTVGAAASDAGLRFLFVFARGGWDTTRVFSPMGWAPRVQTEAEAEEVEHGDMAWVDHPDRPAVRGFFREFGSKLAVLDGMLVRSVNHRICERLVQAGSARSEAPDWASILGSAASADHALPNLVLDGPSNPGWLHRATSIVGKSGQLQGLLDGEAFERGDIALDPRFRPTPLAGARMDALLLSAAEAWRAAEPDPAWARMADAQVDALQRAARLREDAASVSFAATTMEQQLDTAVDILARGVARCVGVNKGGFDTHADTTSQSGLINDLFVGLDRVARRLESTPGRRRRTMAEETVVVVLSEMGRTPYLNGIGGKDHWPYTAAMLWGPGVRGGVRLGGYDDFLSGQPLDLVSGEVRPDGTVLTPAHLGATLLTLGAVDPAAWIEAAPVSAILT
jgi:uncharacterized protein (DUF1501 family)